MGSLMESPVYEARSSAGILCGGIAGKLRNSTPAFGDGLNLVPALPVQRNGYNAAAVPPRGMSSILRTSIATLASAEPLSSPTSPSNTYAVRHAVEAQHGSPWSTPDYTHTTGRKALSMASTAVGSGLMDGELLVSMAAARISTNTSDGNGMSCSGTSNRLSRPASAKSTSAAAWKAYGSPSARGMGTRELTQTDVQHPHPRTSVIEAIGSRAPTVLKLGGGFLLRPQSAPAHHTSGKYMSGSASPRSSPPAGHSYQHRPLSSGQHKRQEAHARPVSAMPRMQQPDSHKLGDGTRYRFAETLPTDPAAKSLYQNQVQRAAQAPTCHASSRAGSISAHSRFNSRSIGTPGTGQQRPYIAPGYSQPPNVLTVPDTSEALWCYSRLGRTQLHWLQQSIRCTEPIGAPRMRPQSAPTSPLIKPKGGADVKARAGFAEGPVRDSEDVSGSGALSLGAGRKKEIRMANEASPRRAKMAFADADADNADSIERVAAPAATVRRGMFADLPPEEDEEDAPMKSEVQLNPKVAVQRRRMFAGCPDDDTQDEESTSSPADKQETAAVPARHRRMFLDAPPEDEEDGDTSEALAVAMRSAASGLSGSKSTVSRAPEADGQVETTAPTYTVAHPAESDAKAGEVLTSGRIRDYGSERSNTALQDAPRLQCHNSGGELSSTDIDASALMSAADPLQIAPHSLPPSASAPSHFTPVPCGAFQLSTLPEVAEEVTDDDSQAPTPEVLEQRAAQPLEQVSQHPHVPALVGLSSLAASVACVQQQRDLRICLSQPPSVQHAEALASRPLGARTVRPAESSSPAGEAPLSDEAGTVGAPEVVQDRVVMRQSNSMRRHARPGSALRTQNSNTDAAAGLGPQSAGPSFAVAQDEDEQVTDEDLGVLQDDGGDDDEDANAFMAESIDSVSALLPNTSALGRPLSARPQPARPQSARRPPSARNVLVGDLARLEDSLTSDE